MKPFKLNPAILRRAECLQQTAMQLRRQAEVAEAVLSPVNTMLEQIGSIGLIDQTVILGRLVHMRDDSDMNQDHGIIIGFQAALLVPEGIGAIAWDVDELWEYRKEDHPDLAVAAQRFVKFDENCPVVKALILPEVGRLFSDFLSRLPLRFRPRLTRKKRSGDM